MEEQRAPDGRRAGAPPIGVTSAFDARGTPVPLDGGEGLSFRVGDLVVKRVHDPAEAAWTADLCARLDPVGFRVPIPVAASDGARVVDGWSAASFVDELRPTVGQWDLIIDAGLRFGAAAERVRDGGEDVLAARSHRWARADRAAWGGSDTGVELASAAADVRARIERLLGDPSPQRQLVHGDLTGNVALDPAGVPVILDVSPYLRPPRWAAAIVIVDAVMWNGASPNLAAIFARDDADRDLLGRALLFRLVAEQLADSPRHGARLEPYDRVLDVVI